MKLNVSFIIIALTLGVAVAGERQNQALRRRVECPDGFGGTNCKVPINECQASPYPCAGGIEKGSFCVDHDPPKKFKCGCRTGYEAVLPNASDVTDNVPVEWRPLKCLPTDVCVDFVCHEDAKCSVSSNNTAVCTCIDDLIGDGITNCAPPPKTPSPKTVGTKAPVPPCSADSDCDDRENSVCVNGSCKCKPGFYQSNGKGHCVNENECADGFPNDCHKNAICKDTEGSYTCICRDGYHDLNPTDKPGKVCAQTNECADPSLNDCNSETHVCLDRPPPSKWECVERTPAPTPAPTPVCINDQIEYFPDTGCSNDNPLCYQSDGEEPPPNGFGSYCGDD